MDVLDAGCAVATAALLGQADQGLQGKAKIIGSGQTVFTESGLSIADMCCKRSQVTLYYTWLSTGVTSMFEVTMTHQIRNGLQHACGSFLNNQHNRC